MLYYFEGPVEFADGDKFVSGGIYTCANSKERAVTNIKYQCRKERCKPKNMKVYLLGEVIIPDSEKRRSKCQVSVDGPLIFVPSKFTEEEWSFLCKVFGLEYAESIALDKYILRTYGIRKENK